MRQCFEMAYYGKLSLGDIQALPVFERRYMYALLRETKKEELEVLKKGRK